MTGGPERWDGRFDHVGIAVADKASARDAFRALFGGTVTWNDRPGAREGGFLATHVNLAGTLIEFIEPPNPASFLTRYLERRGPGIHHLTWKVDRLDDLAAELEANGNRIVDVLRRDGSIYDAFIHPSDAHGLLTQFRPLEHRTNAGWLNSPSREDLPEPLPSRGALCRIWAAVEDPERTAAYFQPIFGGRTIEQGEEVEVAYTGINVRYVPKAAARGLGLFELEIQVDDLEAVLTTAREHGMPVLNDRGNCCIGLPNPTSVFFRLRTA